MKKKICMIYIDFDDTLYEHTFHWTYEEDFEYNMLFGFKQIQYDEKYLNHELISKVEDIIEENKKHDIITIVSLLTGCQSSVFFDAKRDFLDSYTPQLFDNYFSVSTQETKIPMIQAYNKLVEKDNDSKIIRTIVIDDSFIVTSLSQNLGFEAMTPGYFEKHYKIEY